MPITVHALCGIRSLPPERPRIWFRSLLMRLGADIIDAGSPVQEIEART